MSDPTVDCIYRNLHDGTTPDEMVPSEEHVLSEALGGSFTLLKRFVCKACNNRLNSRVDIPMVRAFRGLLNLFRVQAGKHGSRDNATSVLVGTAGGDIEARLLANGSLRPVTGPITKEPVPTENGELVWQFRVRDEREAQQVIDGLCRNYSWKELTVETVEWKEVRIKELPVEGKLEPVYRGAAKTALNYLVWRRPEMAHESSLDGVKQFILNGSAVGSHPHLFTTQEILAGGRFSEKGLSPKHHVAVGREGTILRSTVALFGKFWFGVNLSESFEGEPFHLEHEFDLLKGEHRIADFWAIHPNAFQGLLAENDKSRIRFGEFPMNRWHYLHEIPTGNEWVRCEECSSAAIPHPPTREAALKCHELVTRRLLK